MSNESLYKETGTEADYRIRLRRLELEYELAQTGLKGTLIGALAVMLMLTIVVIVSAFTQVTVLSGVEIVSIFGILLVAVVAYGAFVYRRLVTLFGKLEAGHTAQEREQT